MCGRPDSQEVGSEAAILERVRNSSLVEWSRADNVPGLKPGAEAADAIFGWCGRGASSSAGKSAWKGWWSGDERECRHE
jgi:hypothetical protein